MNISMIRSAYNVWSRVTGIPWLLRCVMLVSAPLGVLAMLFSILPIWVDEDGFPLPLREVWADGFGLRVFLAGAVMILVALLIYQGHPRNRHMLAALFCGLYVREGVSEYVQSPTSLAPLLSMGVYLAITIWYLYFKRDVKAYFAGNSCGGEPKERKVSR